MVIAATDYPFLEIFWTILIFSAWVVWIWMAVTVLVDSNTVKGADSVAYGSLDVSVIVGLSDTLFQY